MDYNIDISRDFIPVNPAAHYIMGGVYTDVNGKTNRRNIFAAGEAARTGVHGANRLASNSLLEGLVFGKRAGELALKECINNSFEHQELEKNIVNKEIMTTDKIEEITTHLKRVMWKKVGILRNHLWVRNISTMNRSPGLLMVCEINPL